MIPISSAKLNKKLANHTRKRSLFNESNFNKRSCVCLSIGVVFGLCLAGIFFYASLPNEEYGSNSKNVIKIMGLEGLQNKTQNESLSHMDLAQKTAQSTFPTTTVSLINTDRVIPEDNGGSNEAE